MPLPAGFRRRRGCEKMALEEMMAVLRWLGIAIAALVGLLVVVGVAPRRAPVADGTAE